MSETEAAKTKFKPVGAVLQTIRLLRVLAQNDKPIGVSAAARLANVNTSTAFNVLRTLAAENMATFDASTKSYGLGPGLYELAKGLGDSKLVELMRIEVERLASDAQCLIALWQITDERLVLIHRAVAARPVRLDMEITQRMPMLLGALGRAVAAAKNIPDAKIRKLFPSLRWQVPLTADQYIAEVHEARERGYAVDREVLYPGIVTVAATINDEQGEPRFGISAIEFAHLTSDAVIEDIGGKLVRACRIFSK
jgi:DNA-binding IclR family transcriptional regulator